MVFVTGSEIKMKNMCIRHELLGLENMSSWKHLSIPNSLWDYILWLRCRTKSPKAFYSSCCGQPWRREDQQCWGKYTSRESCVEYGRNYLYQNAREIIVFWWAITKYDNKRFWKRTTLEHSMCHSWKQRVLVQFFFSSFGDLSWILRPLYASK